jgi:acetyl-CoA carboxylase biotin carboxylase subunit
LGDKIKAKEIAKKLDLPLMPGTKEIKTEKELLKKLKKIKPPFMLKAANGGGGIGMRLIEEKKDKKEILEIFNKLKREVKNTFGSDKIFLEKSIEDPHHIEFQILGDGKKVLHLFERDCSLQRRHQKLVEEAPSPIMDKKLREKMGKAAVKIGEYLKYEGVGTVEFLVDKDKNFYFMEINPRLQVEHPVTEAITGFDLVKEQIKIAQGEKLNLKQKDIKFSGWAMEFRVYAEEAREDFRPKTGQITNFLPAGGKGIEIHSFCHLGQKIYPYFDSLLLKLVVFGKDRKEVILRAKRAIEETILEGVSNLLPFYKFLLKNQDFIEGKISTNFIKKSGILEEFKKAEKPKFEEKETLAKEFSKKELAAILAKFYEKMTLKEREKEEKISNNWKAKERLETFLRENL